MIFKNMAVVTGQNDQLRTGSYFLDDIYQRVHYRDQNFLMAVVGGVGSGKSFSALSMACALDPDFGIDRVVFSPEEFLDLLVNGRLRKGSVMVFDEIGVGHGARNFMKAGNKALNTVFQTYRQDNLITIFTLPHKGMLDKQARLLLHAECRTTGIDYNKKLCYLQPYYTKTDFFTNEEKTQHLRLLTKDGVVRVRCVQIGLPPQALIDAYRLKKRLFTKQLNNDALSKVGKLFGG